MKYLFIYLVLLWFPSLEFVIFLIRSYTYFLRFMPKSVCLSFLLVWCNSILFFISIRISSLLFTEERNWLLCINLLSSILFNHIFHKSAKAIYQRKRKYFKQNIFQYPQPKNNNNKLKTSHNKNIIKKNCPNGKMDHEFKCRMQNYKMFREK